jgi:hypothetical protein
MFNKYNNRKEKNMAKLKEATMIEVENQQLNEAIELLPKYQLETWLKELKGEE